MKTYTCALAGLLFLAVEANGISQVTCLPPASTKIQPALANLPAPTEPLVKERGAHYKVWERIVFEPNPYGTYTPKPRQYTELASGMHYQENGIWKESTEKIELIGNHGVYRQGRYQVIFEANINSAGGAIDLTTPDQKRLTSTPIGLAYYDTASGQSVMIATVQDSIGQLVAENQLVYPDAFAGEGIRGDLRYTIKRSGPAQDVVIRSRIREPKEYGLGNESLRLVVITEKSRCPT